MTKSERIAKLEEEIVELTRIVNDLEQKIDGIKRNDYPVWSEHNHGYYPPIQLPTNPIYQYDKFYC